MSFPWVGTIHKSGGVKVRGEDQLFSFKGVLASSQVDAISGANGYLDSPSCPAGEIWCVTNAAARDDTTATTLHRYNLDHDGARYVFGSLAAALAIAQWSFWGGFKWLDPDDFVRVDFIGGLVGDTCRVTLTGYIMTLET